MPKQQPIVEEYEKLFERANYQSKGWTSLPLGDLNKIRVALHNTHQAGVDQAVAIASDYMNEADHYNYTKAVYD